MLPLYRLITLLSAPILGLLLKRRVALGKEDPRRLNERQGIASLPSPAGKLIWIHAASVGEAQSALILIDKILKLKPEVQFLVTSGTVTSAKLMAKRLPSRATHQFYPLDHPLWVERFLDHWQPDLALWMESELWPNMLRAIKQRNIPAILINARLSDRSYRRWKLIKSAAKKLVSSFSLIMAQTDKDAKRYNHLGTNKVTVTDNIKHGAAPLPYNDQDLKNLKTVIQDRPLWVYASTHDGEEIMACRLHTDLQETFSNVLTIIVPRHPERREEIEHACKTMGLNTTMRGENKNLPNDQTEIYVADTLGELGLFYSLSNIAMIGRSFSNDGGGGHNPIEAAQLDCAVLTGPHIQYQQQLFDEMFIAAAAKQVQTEGELLNTLTTLFNNNTERKRYIEAAKKYAASKENIINHVIEEIKPFIGVSQREVA